jgi:hypothetical protein
MGQMGPRQCRCSPGLRARPLEGRLSERRRGGGERRAGSSSAGRCSANSVHQYPAALSDWCPRSNSVACFAQPMAKSISPISSKASAVCCHTQGTRQRDQGHRQGRRLERDYRWLPSSTRAPSQSVQGRLTGRPARPTAKGTWAGSVRSRGTLDADRRGCDPSRNPPERCRDHPVSHVPGVDDKTSNFRMDPM